MLAELRSCFRRDRVLYTQHARQEMRSEPLGRIAEHEVYEALLDGEVIEDYADDTPYASCLIFGRSRVGRPIHIVCAYAPDDDHAMIVTVYEPDPDGWVDFRRRIAS